MSNPNPLLSNDFDQSCEIATSGVANRPQRVSWRLWTVATGTIGLIALFGIAASWNKPAPDSHATHRQRDNESIPVNIVHPHCKTLERTLAQPGSIEPSAQAELYAKVSGTLQSIRREWSPQAIVELPSAIVPLGGALANATSVAMRAHVGWQNSPCIDIGSRVSAGDILLQIALPELAQDIVQRESLVRQRKAELEAARALLKTFEAAEDAVRAQLLQAKADVRRCESEVAFRSKELKRLQDLVLSRTITQEVADEKENQVNATKAGCESSRAKVQAVEAELSVISSKSAAALADTMVKEALVQIARDDVERAKILADFGSIRAPFTGFVTQRAVDEGDFVQNATSGQSRRLVTVTALDRVKVVLQVPEKDAPWVRVGADAVITLDARTHRQVHGHVARIPYALNAQTRTMQVEIDLPNPDREFLPGMYGRVVLTLQKFPNAQAIPATALFSRKGENYILEVKDGIAHRQRVRVRFDDGKEVEVVKLVGSEEIPLNGTEELIVSNKGEIAEGQRVQATPLRGD